MKKVRSMPLVEALIKHKRINATPFHMPGHKKGRGVQPKFARLMNTDLFSVDLTELPGLDNLHNPTGPILNAQQNAARLFGADRTFYLVNGTTVGIHAAVLTVCRQEEILLPRDVHLSVIGSCILAGCRPRYLPVTLDQEFFVPYPPKAEDVASALQKNRGIKAVFQTYPSYYGLAGDLAEIAKAAHRLNIPLIADEAHGAHFKFSERTPAPALELGADISIQSTHKTLGALTQASMLHIRSVLVDYREVARHLGILQSTSPSYLLMASLDAAVGHIESSGKAVVEKVVDIALRARERINSIPGLRCLGEDISGKQGIGAYDPTKLYISVRELGLTGYQVADKLFKRHRIGVELSDQFNILCMFSIGNTSEDADRLVSALAEIAGKRRFKSKKTSWFPPKLPLPPAVLTPREAWFSTRKAVALENAVGEVAAEIIAPYPPGVPLVCPGEIVSYEVYKMLQELKAHSVRFHGPADPGLETVTVVK